MDIAATIIDLLRERAPNASICPSDVARALAGDERAWRALMQPVRDEAVALASEGRIVMTQRSRAIRPGEAMHGPIRLRRGHAFPH